MNPRQAALLRDACRNIGIDQLTPAQLMFAEHAISGTTLMQLGVGVGKTTALKVLVEFDRLGGFRKTGRGGGPA